MTQTLLVFDLDGTIVQTSAGRRAFNEAFVRVFGLIDAARTVPMAGRTDPAIFRDVCDQRGLDPHTFGAWKLEFLTALAEAMTADPGHILPGVPELLELCRREPGFHLALGTGNVEEGARLKLAPHNLNRYFPTGGFGSDGRTRDEVIARGISRAATHYGREFERILVIGDTPHDISCGKANRCLSVAVATGPYSQGDLAACDPDLLLPDFRDPAAVLARLKSLSA